MEDIDKKVGEVRILSIDGGGVRVVTAAYFLKEIEKKTGKSIAELFDYIVGVSAGGVYTIGSVIPGDDDKAKYSSKYAFDNFEVFAHQMRPQDYLPWVLNSFGIFHSKYNREGIDKFFDEKFGDVKLKDTLIPISVLSFSLKNDSIKVWSTFKAKISETENIYLKDVAGATSAAPIYLDPKKIPETNDYHIDGGIYANNPTIMGIAELFSHCKNLTTENVIVVSLGTGKVGSTSFDHEAGTGIFQWLSRENNIIKMMMNANTSAVDVQAQQIFPRYHRIQMDIPRHLNQIDNPLIVQELKEFAENYFLQNPDLLDGIISDIYVGGGINRLDSLCDAKQELNFSSDNLLIALSNIWYLI
jgi:patatin-like phospholipase/acyl hydrolase